MTLRESKKTNPECGSFYGANHPISTTSVGVKEEDYYKIKDLKT